jgi:hypothetical protein
MRGEGEGGAHSPVATMTTNSCCVQQHTTRTHVQVFELGAASSLVAVGSLGWYSVKLKLPEGPVGDGGSMESALPLARAALEPLGGYVHSQGPFQTSSPASV